jgi:hypothetical protein
MLKIEILPKSKVLFWIKLKLAEMIKSFLQSIFISVFGTLFLLSSLVVVANSGDPNYFYAQLPIIHSPMRFKSSRTALAD